MMIRFTPDEKAAIDELAAETKRKPGVVVRLLVLDGINDMRRRHELNLPALHELTFGNYVVIED